MARTFRLRVVGVKLKGELTEMPLEDDIRKAIEQSLPEQVGTLLKQRLTQAEADAKNLKNAEASASSYRSERDALQARLDRHEELSKRIKALDEREAAILKREQNQAVIEARHAAAEDKCKAIFELAGMAFRNPRITTFESVNRNMPVTGQYGIEDRHINESRSVTQETQ